MAPPAEHTRDEHLVEHPADSPLPAPDMAAAQTYREVEHDVREVTRLLGRSITALDALFSQLDYASGGPDPEDREQAVTLASRALGLAASRAEEALALLRHRHPDVAGDRT